MNTVCLGKNKPGVVFRAFFFFLLTTFALCSGVQVKDNIQGLSQLPGCGFALPVLTDGSDVNGLGVEAAVEEFLRLQQDRKASLRVQHTIHFSYASFLRETLIKGTNTHTCGRSPWIHTAGVSSRVLNSQCKQSLAGGWSSEGSGGPSL